MRAPQAILSALTLAALAGCSARGDAPRPPTARDPLATRGGWAPALSGVRLRPRTAETELAPAYSEPEERREWSDSGAYGPRGDEGSDVYDAPWDPGTGWGYGYAVGPGGAVPPGLRAPSNAPVLRPASPYRGPADPPDVYRRPGTVSGNDTFRAR